MHKKWLIISIVACLLCAFGGWLIGIGNAADYSAFLKNDKVVSMSVLNDEANKVDMATINTKSGKCYQFQLKKGKIIAWKTCSDTEWKSN